MTQENSQREWETLSAYLDGQLSATERRRLEARLHENAKLQSDLEQMRQIQTILRSQPKLRAPRNFTLNADMVGADKPKRTYPALQLAWAVASILLVFVLLGDFLTGPVSSPILMAAPQTEAASELVTEMPLQVMEVPVEQPVEEPAQVYEEQQAGEEEAPAARMEALPPPPASGTESPPAALEKMAQPTPSVAPQLLEDTSEQIVSTSTLDQAQPALFDSPILVLVEIALLLFALGTGVVLLFLRRTG